MLDVFQHERLVFVFDFDNGWNKFGRLAIDLNGYTHRRGQFDVFSLANAFTSASQLKLGLKNETKKSIIADKKKQTE